MDKNKYLSQREAKRLMTYCRNKAKKTKDPFYVRSWAIIDTLLSTGIRGTECRKIKVEDCDLSREPTIKVHGKGGRVRTCEISQSLSKHLKHFIDWKKRNNESVAPDSYLFINRKKRHYTIQGIEYMFKKMAKEAKLRSCYTLHSTRHTFGFMVYGMSKNIRLTQELLGHRSLSSTQIYAHVDPTAKVAAINGLWGG